MVLVLWGSAGEEECRALCLKGAHPQLWQPGGAEEDSCLREGNRHLHLAYDEEEEVVKASTSRAEDPGFESRLRWDFSGSSHTSDLKIGTPVAALPGAWHYKVSAETGQPSVSIL